MKELKKLLEKMQKEIDKLIKANNEEITQAKAEIDTIREHIASLENDVKEARSRFDADLAVELNHQINDEKTRLEIFQKKLEYLNTKPLIEFDDYESMITNLYDKLNEIENRNKENLLSVLDDCINEIDDFYSSVNNANSLLKNLYRQIYRVGQGKDCEHSIISRHSPEYMTSIQNIFNELTSLRRDNYFDDTLTGRGGKAVLLRDVIEIQAKRNDQNTENTPTPTERPYNPHGQWFHTDFADGKVNVVQLS